MTPVSTLAKTFLAVYTAVIAGALAPPERVGPSEWAERYRILGAKVAAEPGPYRMSRTPYLREIHDALGDPRIRKVVVQAPAQTGKSELGRNFIGWIADQSPGPVLLVLPTKETAREHIDERVIPMFQDTPQLAALLTGKAHDLKKSAVICTTCTIYTGWSGSANALASRPIQYVILDEVDKYPPYSGKEADPISLAEVRTQTYEHRAKIYIVSTPTVDSGPIAKAYNGCIDRRTCHVPCPLCDVFNELEWKHVHWEGQDESTEEDLRSRQAAFDAGLAKAWYECPSCEGHITDAQRLPMVARGKWVSSSPYGGESVAFKVPGLVSPWRTSFTILAQEFVAARIGGIEKLHHFFNSRIGIPFWSSSEGESGAMHVDPAVLWAKSAKGHACEVPEWARVLIATADPGKRETPWVVRAWGDKYRSRLISCGVARSFAELQASTIDRRYALTTGGEVRCGTLAIDTGGGTGERSASRTDEIYRFARTDPARILPLKGLGGSGKAVMPVRTSSHTYTPPGEKSDPYAVTLSVIDVGYFKDVTAARINSDNEELWELPAGMGKDYVMQVCAERRRLVERRVKPTGEVTEVWRWMPRVTGAANHYWDCEVYQSVAAYMLDELDDVGPTLVSVAAVARSEELEPEEPETTWVDGGEWWPGEGGGW